MEKINCNENTLIFFLQKVAQAHNVEFINSMDEDGQVLLKSEDVPVVADVKSVVEAFCLPTSENVEVGWGYTTVYISDLVEEGRFRNEVDIQTLSMALPKGVVKINESKLKKVISESIKRVLSETKGINEISDNLLDRARDEAFRDMTKNWNNGKIRTKRQKQ